MLLTLRFLTKSGIAALAALFLLAQPENARAQNQVPVTRGVSPLISQYDPNAITALQTGFNAVSGGLPMNLQITRFRVNTVVTGSGFLSEPLTIVTQFGQGGQGGQLGQGGNNGFGGGGGYQNYGQGASGVAGGAAAGIGLASTANLYRQPPGVQINSVYGGLTGLPMGQNNFLSANQRPQGGGINFGGGFGGGVGKPFGNGGYGL
jgi:hypothetical protein